MATLNHELKNKQTKKTDTTYSEEKEEYGERIVGFLKSLILLFTWEKSDKLARLRFCKDEEHKLVILKETVDVICC